jgi:IS1 family transposase
MNRCALSCEQIGRNLVLRARSSATSASPTQRDQWTFVALDRDTKLVPSYLIGKRTLANATTYDLEWLSNRVQLSSDA